MSGASEAAKAAILARIRDAVGAPAGEVSVEYQRIARDYRQAASLSLEDRIRLFADRLEHYQVGVHRPVREALPDAIAQVLAARGKARLLVPSGVPRDWLPATLEVVEDAGLSYADLDRSDGVLTGCSVAIATTGTIVLRHEAAEGRRALTLVPDYHLCVVFEEQVVETVPEAIRLLAGSGPRLVTTIAGPSATADIEMTRIRGVHGPRTFDVVVGR